MRTATNNKIQYKDFFKTQNFLLKELEQIKRKIMILGSLRRFENLARKGRQFAKNKKIKLADVLKND